MRIIPSGTTSNVLIFTLYGSHKEKGADWEHNWRENTWKPPWEKKQTSKSRKYRESHTGLTQRGTHQNIVIKMAIIEDREYQKFQENSNTLHTGELTRLSAEFSAETLSQKGVTQYI